MSELETLKKENEELKEKLKSQERKYLPGLGELIDRLGISQMKEFFIADFRKEYSQEIKDILHDINSIIKEKNLQLSAELIRLIIVNILINREIWINESNCRNGVNAENNLILSHSLNSIRCTSKNKIQEFISGRKDYKIDVIEPNFKYIPSWD